MRKLYYWGAIVGFGLASLLIVPKAVELYNKKGEAASVGQLSSETQSTVRTIKSYSEIEKLISEKDKIAFKIGATWSKHCGKYDSVFKEVAKAYGREVTFCETDLDKVSKEEAHNFITKINSPINLQYVPTTIFFSEGKKIGKLVIGYKTKKELTGLVEENLKED